MSEEKTYLQRVGEIVEKHLRKTMSEENPYPQISSQRRLGKSKDQSQWADIMITRGKVFIQDMQYGIEYTPQQALDLLAFLESQKSMLEKLAQQKEG